MFRVTCIFTARLVTDNVDVLTEITTSVPVMVSTDAPKTTVTVSVKNAEWITTVTVPPIVADTGAINPTTHAQMFHFYHDDDAELRPVD